MRSKIVLHLPEDMRAALRQRAQAEETSVSGVILAALEHYFAAEVIPDPPPPPGATLSVRLTPQAAQAIASRTHRATISAVARAAISAYLGNDRWQGQLVEVPVRLPEALARALRAAAESGGREALFAQAIARAMQLAA
jgi:predicted transcriptional regulator